MVSCAGRWSVLPIIITWLFLVLISIRSWRITLSGMSTDGDGGYVKRRILIHSLAWTHDEPEYFFQIDCSWTYIGMTTHAEINNRQSIDSSRRVSDVI
jgi:hypothetical protein